MNTIIKNLKGPEPPKPPEPKFKNPIGASNIERNIRRDELPPDAFKPAEPPKPDEMEEIKKQIKILIKKVIETPSSSVSPPTVTEPAKPIVKEPESSYAWNLSSYIWNKSTKSYEEPPESGSKPVNEDWVELEETKED